MFKVLFLLTAFIAVANALMCPPNICAMYPCPITLCTTNQIKVKNSDYCNCCDRCIDQIPLGGHCGTFFIKGLQPSSQCAPGLTCDPKFGKCVIM